MKNDKNTINTKKQSASLIYCAFIAGLCSIIYELLIATTVSYFLGDSVKFFSITIGIYMAAMGVGSFVSKYIDKQLLKKFISAELLLGLFGGLSVPALYFAYAYTNQFILVYISFTVIIGFLIGLEIPFLTRLMQDYNSLKFNIANILSFDYAGALIATLAFPFLLLPFLGVYQSSLFFGLINMSIGFVVILAFKDKVKNDLRFFITITIIFTAIIIAMIIFSNSALKHWNKGLYRDRVVHSEQSKYQKIVLTKFKDDVRLFLDGNLQFSSIDEHRYHESLIDVPLSVHNKPVRRVLLLGAGDGLAVRQLLKYPQIEEIVLVDLDQKIIDLSKNNSHILKLNQNSLSDDKVKIIISDAFTFLTENNKPFDFIINDLPDPNNTTLARLYSQQFYQMLRNNLNEDGIFVTQATSPYFATDAFWSIVKTVKSSGFNYVYPYHALVPSFGDWGFVMASSYNKEINSPNIKPTTKFLSQNNFKNLFIFPEDINNLNDIKVNQLDKPILLNYYIKGWKNYSRD